MAPLTLSSGVESLRTSPGLPRKGQSCHQASTVTELFQDQEQRAFTVSGCCLRPPRLWHNRRACPQCGSCILAQLWCGQVCHRALGLRSSVPLTPFGYGDFMQDLVSFKLVFKKGSTSILIKVYNIHKELEKLFKSIFGEKDGSFNIQNLSGHLDSLKPHTRCERETTTLLLQWVGAV